MKNQNRKLIVLFAIGLLIGSQRVMATTTDGPYDLDLAAVVAAHSPNLSRTEKHVMARLFDGHSHVAFPATRKISIRVKAIDCKESEISDITLRICSLTFGARNIFLNGRAAHELYATLAQVGVASEGAAGSIEERLSNLVCTINPHAIAQVDGSGADCSFHARLIHSCKTGPR